MEILSVPLARTLAFLDFSELDKGGTIYLPKLVEEITRRYQFARSPDMTKPLDLSDNGAVFEDGFFAGRRIPKFTIYNLSIFLDTLSSTEDSQEQLLEILNWSKANFGLTYRPESIKRWAYVSDVVFRSEFPLLSGQSRALNSVASKVTAIVQANLKESIEFQPASIQISHDPQTRSSRIASFSIQPRAGALFGENIYYSEAPIPTSNHVEMLRDIEADFRERYASL